MKLVFKILHYTERVHGGRAIALLSGQLQHIQKFHLSGGKNGQHCEQNRQFINEMLERQTGERSSRLGSGLLVLPVMANSPLNTMGIYTTFDCAPLPRIGDSPNGLHTDLKFQNQAIQCCLFYIAM